MSNIDQCYKYATHLGHQYFGTKTKAKYIYVGLIMLGLLGRISVGFHYYVNIAWCLNLELRETDAYTQTIIPQYCFEINV